VTIAIAPAALAIAAGLFDSLWEGALIVGAVWLGLRFRPKLGATTRYAIWLCALGALLLIPVGTVCLSMQQSPESTSDAAMATRERSSVSVRRVAQPRLNAADVPATSADVVTEPTPELPRKSQIAIPEYLAIAVALIWVLVACVRATGLVLDFWELAAIRRTASLWSAAHEYPVFLSHRARVPLAIGFLRKAIILPASLIEAVRADAVKTIIIHEAAHLRRYDVWTNALARIIEAFVALNPAAWFIMRRLSMEREIACDDWVVVRTGSGDHFANVLARLACGAGSHVPLVAPSAIGSRHSTVVRIERLLEAGPRRVRLSPAALGGALMLLALIAFVMQSLSPVLAFEPTQPILAQASEVAVAPNCAVPNRGIRLAYLLGRKRHRTGSPPLNYELQRAREVVARFGAAKVATFELTVDAAGTPRKVVIISAPRYPGMVEPLLGS